MKKEPDDSVRLQVVRNQVAAKPKIKADIQNLSRITQETWEALKKANEPPELFKFGEHPHRLKQTEKGRLIAEFLTPDRLRYELAERLDWYVEKRGNDKIVTEDADAKPPNDVVKNMLATPDPPLPSLKRIVQAPVFAADGTLLTAPGYHLNSGTYYDPVMGFSLPPVSEHPTDGEVEAARDLILNDLLTDFPFACDADRAHAVGLMILLFARELIDGPTPLHLIEAPRPGTGKGLLVQVLLIPALGKEISLMTQADNDEEWRKRITSSLWEAPPVIQIDNITSKLDSAALAGALTAPVWKDRILGKSQNIHLPVQCVWVATANNPITSTEIVRRCVRIRLVPEEERPWRREGFRHENLTEWAMENRGKLVWAALTLIRNWLAAGRLCPNAMTLGSFEQWSRVIGGILEAAGVSGFLGNLDAFYEAADVDRNIWSEFVALWAEELGMRTVTTADLFPLAQKVEGFELEGKGEHGQKISLGCKLTEQRDAIYGKFRIVSDKARQRAKRWKLVQHEPPKTEPGVSMVSNGESFTPLESMESAISESKRGGKNTPKLTILTADTPNDGDHPNSDKYHRDEEWEEFRI